MAPTYWLDLFSGQTWDEYLKSGGTVSGFRITQKKAAEKVKVGDRLLCYVVGISRFIGVLEVRSPAYEDDTRIWCSDVFPMRFRVAPVVVVPFENALPMTELIDRLKITQGASSGGNNFGYLFQGSLRKWPTEDGELITAELHRENQYPTKRPVDMKKLYKATSFSVVNTARTAKGDVTVPANEDTRSDVPPEVPQETATRHTELQWLLLKLGSDMGLNVWVARNDRNKEFQGRRFTDIPRLAKEIPSQFTDAVRKTIELIDVLWLRKDAIVGAFEIESTTSIYSGLLRMADLISMQPNLSIPLYIVAPDERRAKVIEEINRPTFANLPKPMSSICRYIAFSDLREAVQKNQAVIRYLPPDYVWEEIAESCELEVD